MDRPTGVTILSVLSYVGAAFYVFWAMVMLLGYAVGPEGVGSRGTGITLIAEFGVLAGVGLLLLATLSVIVGIGLWKLRNWARRLSIIFMALGVAGCVLNMLGALAGPNILKLHILKLLFNAALGYLYGWIIRYLLQPHVKHAFGVS